MFFRVLGRNPLLQQNVKSLIKTVSASFSLNYSSNAGKNNDHIAFDFGTSKINVASVDKNDKPKVIHTQTFTVPVDVEVDGYHIISDHAVMTVRHFIGRKFVDSVVQKEIKKGPFNIDSGHNGGVVIKLCGGELCSPTMLLKEFLEKAKKEAELCLGKSLSRAVITLPSVFDGEQLREMVKAGLGAGFQLIHNIDETTATAIAYGMYKKEKGCLFVVIDMGFRSFDVTLMEISDSGRIKFKWQTKSDMSFGGDDFDIALKNYFVSEYIMCERTKSILRDKMWGHGTRCSEMYKKALSSEFEIRFNVPMIVPGQPTRVLQDMTLSRSKFESIVNPLIVRIKSQIESYLEETGTNPKDVDEVLLVGGMARVPKIRKVVSQIFGKSPKRGDNGLDEAVALGAAAAVQAGHFGEDPWNSN